MTCWEERARLGTRALRLRLAPGRGDPFSASAGGLLPSLSLSSSAAGGLRLRSGAVRLGTGGLGASDFGTSPSCADMRLAKRTDEGIDAFKADIVIHCLYLPSIMDCKVMYVPLQRQQKEQQWQPPQETWAVELP